MLLFSTDWPENFSETWAPFAPLPKQQKWILSLPQMHTSPVLFLTLLSCAFAKSWGCRELSSYSHNYQYGFGQPTYQVGIIHFKKLTTDASRMNLFTYEISKISKKKVNSRVGVRVQQLGCHILCGCINRNKLFGKQSGCTCPESKMLTSEFH